MDPPTRSTKRSFSIRSSSSGIGKAKRRSEAEIQRRARALTLKQLQLTILATAVLFMGMVEINTLDIVGFEVVHANPPDGPLISSWIYVLSASIHLLSSGIASICYWGGWAVFLLLNRANKASGEEPRRRASSGHSNLDAGTLSRET
ncbi:hypothetical protein H9P43_001564 [Blastocladiella emersonii ATCC 22665]|nr:hypothetical protein H9P43_001564 [Blastocladiella emersonii ATCC 22665]